MSQDITSAVRAHLQAMRDRGVRGMLWRHVEQDDKKPERWRMTQRLGIVQRCAYILSLLVVMVCLIGPFVQIVALDHDIMTWFLVFPGWFMAFCLWVSMTRYVKFPSVLFSLDILPEQGITVDLLPSWPGERDHEEARLKWDDIVQIEAEHVTSSASTLRITYRAPDFEGKPTTYTTDFGAWRSHEYTRALASEFEALRALQASSTRVVFDLHTADDMPQTSADQVEAPATTWTGDDW